jgi:hypothetical protein
MVLLGKVKIATENNLIKHIVRNKVAMGLELLFLFYILQNLQFLIFISNLKGLKCKYKNREDTIL